MSHFRVIEFKDVETAVLAIDKMHRYDVKGRHLVVREVVLHFLSVQYIENILILIFCLLAKQGPSCVSVLKKTLLWAEFTEAESNVQMIFAYIMYPDKGSFFSL